MKINALSVPPVSDLPLRAVKLVDVSRVTMSSVQTVMRPLADVIDVKLATILTCFHRPPSSASHAQATASLAMTLTPATNVKTRETCTSRKTSTRMDVNVTRKKDGSKKRTSRSNANAREILSTKKASASTVNSSSTAARLACRNLNRSSTQCMLEPMTQCQDNSLT